jgi:hypothetical protein
MNEGSRLRLPLVPVEATGRCEGYQALGVSEIFSEAVMVELRLRDGERIGLPYPWLGQVRFKPPTITLSFTTGVQVTIHGRNLDPVFSALLRHQAVYIREADRPTLLLAAGTLVESIEVEQAGRL